MVNSLILAELGYNGFLFRQFLVTTNIYIALEYGSDTCFYFIFVKV
jgi:hypothetical protein